MKKFFIILLTTITVVTSFITPTIAFADEMKEEESKSKSKITQSVGDYNDGEDGADLISKFSKEDFAKIEANRNSIKYVLKRVLSPQYLNNTVDGTIAKEISDKDPRDANGYACNPNEPQNLLNHNCDIPNFSAELMQTFMGLMSPGGIENGKKTQSKAGMGFGVPNNIPGKLVPVNPNNRSHKYTALELYGYNLEWTTYNGEWDRISTATQARMLSNFGLMDRFRLAGNAFFNSIQSGVGSLIEGFSFNPILWAGNVFNAFVSSGFNTIIDSSDLNVLATNSWYRTDLNNTLYNVYVLSDKDVIDASAKRFTNFYIDRLFADAEKDPHLQKVLSIETPPVFEYDPDRITDESKEEIERVEKINAENKKKAEEDPEYKYKELAVPDPVHMTEAEQFEEYKEDNKSALDEGRNAGLMDDKAKTYDEMLENWTKKWEPYMKREFEYRGKTVGKIGKDIQKDFFANDPYSDPKQPISHYVCADENGNPIKSSNGNYEYLYKDYNKGSKEFLNPKCKAPRPSIRGAYYGSGWHTEVSGDTRYIQYVSTSQSIPIKMYHAFRNSIANLGKKTSSFIAKVTNTVLGLSFEPLLTKLGVVKIIEELVKGFSESVFMPLVVIFVAIGAISIMAEFLKDRNFMKFLGTVGISILLFVGSIVALSNPASLSATVDKIPSQFDNMIADSVLKSGTGSGLCTTDGNRIGDAVRSAQCNVWEVMVFSPWVHGQFGTGYDQLYAKGKGSGSGEFKNKNESLVGDAGVYMGGGHTEHNWAMYQLDKTKAGTITTAGEMSNTPDPNLYRLVDLQAGPNNGELSDDRYLQNWATGSGRASIGLLSIITSITTGLALIGVGFKKIEFSFLLGMSIIGLPFMMLRSFTSKGQNSIKEYLMTMLNLLFKRLLTTVMLVTMLKIYSILGGSTASYPIVAMSITGISVAFMLYKNELYRILSISNNDGIFTSEQVSRVIGDTVPLSVRNKAYRTKANIQGSIAGGIGGFMAGYSHLNKYNTFEDEDGNVHKVQNFDATMSERLRLATHGASRGMRSGAVARERMEKNKIARSGFSIGEVYRGSKDVVVDEGVEKITENIDATAADVYREYSKDLEYGTEYFKSSQRFSREDARAMRDPRLQKLLRDEAKRRQEMLNDPDNKAIKMKEDQIEEATNKIDELRERNIAKHAIRHPLSTGAEYLSSVAKNEEMKGLEKHKREIKVNSNVEETIEQLQKELRGDDKDDK